LWKKKPKKEYRIWIPSETSPMRIISFFKKVEYCFGNLIETFVDTTKSPDDDGYLVKRPGLTIKIYGQTEETKVSEFSRFIIKCFF
jgi:hypothetical protein